MRATRSHVVSRLPRRLLRPPPPPRPFSRRLLRIHRRRHLGSEIAQTPTLSMHSCELRASVASRAEARAVVRVRSARCGDCCPLLLPRRRRRRRRRRSSFPFRVAKERGNQLVLSQIVLNASHDSSKHALVIRTHLVRATSHVRPRAHSRVVVALDDRSATNRLEALRHQLTGCRQTRIRHGHALTAPSHHEEAACVHRATERYHLLIAERLCEIYCLDDLLQRGI
mmetsp:Transcript_11914/g.27022  ORF Transcript_11914/g.27022 Transcript_11914/m.27022 type:complete len:226 (+) Transcript_11914:229-906(+)